VRFHQYIDPTHRVKSERLWAHSLFSEPPSAIFSC
jgi:hypothetical protein